MLAGSVVWEGLSRLNLPESCEEGLKIERGSAQTDRTKTKRKLSWPNRPAMPIELKNISDSLG